MNETLIGIINNSVTMSEKSSEVICGELKIHILNDFGNKFHFAIWIFIGFMLLRLIGDRIALHYLIKKGLPIENYRQIKNGFEIFDIVLWISGLYIIFYLYLF